MMPKLFTAIFFGALVSCGAQNSEKSGTDDSQNEGFAFKIVKKSLPQALAPRAEIIENTRPASPFPIPVDPAVIINIAKQILKIVQENMPVANVKTEVAHAMPQGITTWTELSGWNVPTSTDLYEVEFVNKFGYKGVLLSWAVQYTHGGSLNGQGKYLTRVQVVPHTVDVRWGYKVNAEARILGTSNVGTLANPVAGIELEVVTNVKTQFRSYEKNCGFYVQGDGFSKSLHCDQPE